jgi:PAS domain S-box-containing protein
MPSSETPPIAANRPERGVDADDRRAADRPGGATPRADVTAHAGIDPQARDDALDAAFDAARDAAGASNAADAPDAADLARALDRHAAVSVSGLDGTLRHVNRRCCTLSGYAREELVGADHRIVTGGVHPPAFHQRMMETLRAGRVWRGAMCSRTKSGALYWVDATLVPLAGPDGRPDRFVAIRDDVTERRRDEEALREQLRFGEALLDALPVAIFHKDAQGRFLHINRALEWMFGIDRRTTIGRGSGEVFANGYADVHVERDRELLARPSRQSYEMEMPLPDGTPRTLYYSKASTTDAGGAVTGVIGVILDITERKTLERSLEVAKDAAEAASRTKSRFLANMSHEIRTPMNGIIGMTELVLDSTLTADQRDALEAVRQSAHALMEIIDDLLDLSKIEAGRLELESIEFEPRALLENLCKPLAVQAQRKGLALRVELPASLPARVRGDPGRLRQVLLNLLGNALKFTERGEVALLAAVPPVEAADARGVTLELEVRDTGIGIPGDKLALIFDAFAQADTSTTRRFGGTGLGLAITRRLLEAMGGTIDVDSTPGVGSRFLVRVPLAEVRPHPAIAAAAAAADAGAGAPGADPAPDDAPMPARRVLLAEDNPVNQQLATLMLRRLGHEVVVAANGAEALARVAEGGFDLVLMDMQMPVMDGIEATRRLRAEGHALPIVAMTANAMDVDRERCLEAGMDGFLAKPVRAQALARALRDAIFARTASRG